MGDLVKVLAAEVNGVDLEDVEEVLLEASKVALSNINFTSTDVEGALVEALSSGGGDDVHSGQHLIDLGDTVTVQLKKQMRIFQHLTIAGTLILDGWLTIEETY